MRAAALLRSIELTPISLGWKDARHRRGRPRLAGAEEGRAILDRFAALSHGRSAPSSQRGAVGPAGLGAVGLILSRMLTRWTAAGPSRPA